MAINFTRYIDITSGVGGAAAVARRDLVGRFFTTNPLLPPASFAQFTTADEVKAYFGSSSVEYGRALFYFSWVSKLLTRPQKIQYARWVGDDVPPRVFGQVQAQSLSTYTGITAGSFGMTIGETEGVFSSINFSSASSLTNVASILQAAIRGEFIIVDSCVTTMGSPEITMTDTTGIEDGMIVTGTGIPDGTTVIAVDSGVQVSISNSATASGTTPITFYNPEDGVWVFSTVSYDSTRGAFNFVGGVVGPNTISVQEGVGGTPIAGIVGWVPQSVNVNGNLTAGAIWSDGADAESVTDTLSASAIASNNFGSFAFVPTLTIDEVVEAATWNKTQNVTYLYSIPVSTINYPSWAIALASIGGCGLTLSDIETQYPEQMPMMIEAATNYNRINATQNYMFQQFSGITASVNSSTLADVLDAVRVNYYGRTQQAGQFIDFYQRGLLMGLVTDPLDMNTYVNEIWLKDAAGAALMSLLISLSEVSANAQGRSQVLATLQSIITEALNNGVISVGKTLTSLQKMYITELTGDPNAFYQVQTIGYWVDCQIVASGAPVEYKAVYTLVYSKDDVIRKVEGTHVLI